MCGAVGGDVADRFRFDRRTRPRQWNFAYALRRASLPGENAEDRCQENEPNSHSLDLCCRGTRRHSFVNEKFRAKGTLAGNIWPRKVEEKLIPANLNGNWPI